MRAQCFYCKKDIDRSDLRPYGPDGALICMPCVAATPEREAETEARLIPLILSAAEKTGYVQFDDDGPYSVPAGTPDSWYFPKRSRLRC